MSKTLGLVVIVITGWVIYTQLIDSSPEDYSDPHQRIEFQAFDEFGYKIDTSLKSMLQGFPTRLYEFNSPKCETQLLNLDKQEIELAVFVVNKKRLGHPVQRVDAFCVESNGFDETCSEQAMAKIPQTASGIDVMQLTSQALDKCTQERRVTPIRTIYPF